MEEVQILGRKMYGELASVYITSYVYNKQFIDKKYAGRKKEILLL